MTAQELQYYIETHIPIVKSNNFTVTEISGTDVTITGRHEDHLNHRNSVFGGSISTIMTLAGWSQVRLITEELKTPPMIVVKSQTVDFLKPVFTDFRAGTGTVAPEEKERFLDMFLRLGKSRLTVSVELLGDNSPEIMARYSGEFVIMEPAESR